MQSDLHDSMGNNQWLVINKEMNEKNCKVKSAMIITHIESSYNKISHHKHKNMIRMIPWESINEINKVEAMY